MHVLQPEHMFSSTQAVLGSSSICPESIRTRTLAAAASAWATVSGMSFAPWQAPATITPSLAVFTGASLGCFSRKKPSAEQEMPNATADVGRVGLRLQGHGQDHHVHLDLADRAQERVVHLHHQAAPLPRSPPTRPPA